MKYTMQQQLLNRKNLAYIKMKQLREQARIARIEFDLASKELEEHKIQLNIKRMAGGDSLRHPHRYLKPLTR